MTIKKQLRILALLTFAAMGLLIFTTAFGLRKIQDAESTAYRHKSNTKELLEIKANAISTAMLDPLLQDSSVTLELAATNVAAHTRTAVSGMQQPEVATEFLKIMAGWKRYHQNAEEVIAHAAIERVAPLYANELRPFLEELDVFIERREADALQSHTEAEQVSRKIFWTLLILAAAVGLTVAGRVALLSRNMQKHLSAMEEKLAVLRTGDLTQRLPVRGKDELSQIAIGVNTFVDELQNIVLQARYSADKVKAEAIEMATVAEQMAQGAHTQADSAAAAAAAIQQLSVSVASISDAASEAEQLSQANSSSALEGSRSIQQLQEEVSRIEAAVTSIASHIDDFIANSQAISNLTVNVREIAEQTNLLALNAAIEAARAGDHGRGFSVVADEVRKLSERSAKSASEIATVTAQLDSQSLRVSDSVTHGLASLDVSKNFIRTVAGTLSNASHTAGKVRADISQISHAVTEQRVSSTEIANKMEVIARITEENRQINTASVGNAEALRRLAGSLTGMIERFTV